MGQGPAPRPAPGPVQAGFTLMEVMVAAVILGMTVSAVAIMIINASDFRLGNDHYRQARVIAQEELEGLNYHFFAYPFFPLFAQAISLDFAEGGQTPTVAARTVTPSPQANQVIQGINVPYMTIVSSITWNDAGRPMSVAISKRVARAR